MAEKTLSDQISHLMNDTPEAEPASSGEKPDEQKDILVENLKVAAGQSDGALDAALDEFLSGKGALHEATRSAITRGGDSALTEVIQLLTKQFKLSPAMAKMIASLIVKLQSSGAQESTTPKKPRRKAKPKTAQKETSSAKKAKKKTAAKAKKTTSKTAAKKKATSKAKPRTSTQKTTSKTGKKKTAAMAKPKKTTRTDTVEIQ